MAMMGMHCNAPLHSSVLNQFANKSSKLASIHISGDHWGTVENTQAVMQMVRQMILISTRLRALTYKASDIGYGYLQEFYQTILDSRTSGLKSIDFTDSAHWFKDEEHIEMFCQIIARQKNLKTLTLNYC